MTMRILNAAGCAAAIAMASLVMGTSTMAATVECTGPLKQCAIEVGAFCEMENGKQMMWYKDREGSSRRLEECIGRVYEAHGKPNPYRPASTQKPAPKR